MPTSRLQVPDERILGQYDDLFHSMDSMDLTTCSSFFTQFSARLVDLQATSTLQAEDLHYRHPLSPYVGHTFQGQIVQTLVRGTTVYQQGHFPLARHGRLVTPA